MNEPSFNSIFSLLPETENPKQGAIEGVPCILHEDHRWLLPIAHVAQEAGILPKPCTVVMYDSHHDAFNPQPGAFPKLRQLRARPSLRGLVSLCGQFLSNADNDWLKAGMEIGMFGDAAVFGVEDPSNCPNGVYIDRAGLAHRIECDNEIPGTTALSPQGHLADVCRMSEFRPLWQLVGWESSHHTFRFVPNLRKILLSIDLDCFSVMVQNHLCQWPTKVFREELLKPATCGWTGAAFLRALAMKAGLVTIEREHGCCGGREESEGILRNLIQYGFDGR